MLNWYKRLVLKEYCTPWRILKMMTRWKNHKNGIICVPIPGRVLVKSTEHVSDIDANYKPPALPLPLYKGK